METKHTPGPWKAVISGHVAFVRTVDNSADLASIGLASHPVDVANARLMAAAPELLEAVSAIVAQLDKSTAGGRGGIDSMTRFIRDTDTHQAFAKARAALAKARGNE